MNLVVELPEVPVDSPQNLAFNKPHVTVYAIVLVTCVHVVNGNFSQVNRTLHNEPYCAEHPAARHLRVCRFLICARVVHVPERRRRIVARTLCATVFTEPLV